MQVKRALTKEQSRMKLLEEKKRKLFLINLPEEAQKEPIHQYFTKYGEVEDTRIIREKKKKKIKIFGFVLFRKENDMRKVFKDGLVHDVQGVQIECKPTLLREELKTIKQQKAIEQKEKNLENKRRKRREKKKRRKLKKRAEKQQQQGENANQEPQGALGPPKSKKIEIFSVFSKFEFLKNF